jgi:GntR family transcriptional regulator
VELSRDDRAPLHFQLQDRIEELASRLPDGTAIPSERQLSAQFAVSRTTVRHAIANLVHSGVLRRQHGLGTFVAEPKFVQRWTELTSFTAGVSEPGVVPSARLIARGLVPAPPSVCESLGVRADTTVVFVERLRLINGKPAVINRSYFPARFGFLLDVDLEGSLWDALESEAEVRIVRATQRLELGMLSDDDAAVLEADPGSPTFVIRSLAFDAEDRPIEAIHATYRGAMTQFWLELRRESAAASGASSDLAVTT